MILVAALATAMVVYSGKVASTAVAVRDEKKAHEELNKVLEEAKKNHNKVAQNKADEIKNSLLAAQETLKEAEAQARLNYLNAEGARRDLPQIYGGAVLQSAGPMADVYKKELAENPACLRE